MLLIERLAMKISCKQKVIIRKMKKQGIPPLIIKYTENVFKNKVQGKYSETLMRFPKKVIRDIDLLIREASIATNQTPNALIDSTDFNSSDLPSDRIEAFFAELRAVNYLALEGFKGIEFIKSMRKQKRADLLAKKDGFNYIVEVTCSSSYATNDNWQTPAIIKYIIRKLEGSPSKRTQLKRTLAEYNADRMVLVVVLDTEDKNALNSSTDAMHIAKQVWLRTNDRNCLHICIILGRPDIVYDIPSGSFLTKILKKSGYIKGHPVWIRILSRLICIFGTRIETGSGNIVYPPWSYYNAPKTQI